MVLRDLFPLYRERLLQEETLVIMKKHLEGCKECKANYEKYCQKMQRDELEERQQEREKDKKVIKFLRDYRKRFILMTGSMLVTLLTVIALFITLVITGGWTKRSSNISDYPHILTEETNMGTGFFIFPEKLTEKMTDIAFDYYYKDTLFDPTISVFLQVTYEQKQYEEEINRLSNLQKKQKDGIKKLIRDNENKYPYPAFIAVENHGNSYEYALLSGETQITYIYTMNFSKDEILFEEKYLPADFMTEKGKEFGSGYSVYVETQSSSFISYDYRLD